MSVAVTHRSTPHRASRSRRHRDQRGAALVEFAIAVVVLLMLLFGIIEYGYALSFKQGLTQASAEGARAAAVASTGTAATAAQAAVTKSVAAFNKTCGTGGLTCTYSTLAADTGCAVGTSCIRVQVSYDYNHYPLMPKFPGLGLLLPNTLTSTSITQVN
ncbi:MAG TPA: TadE/TadG family type IV pilus assembly protein [Acidimicrobiia bacterium]|nr:TadE/TadG family type IV pilus assembly protein [Acidimicrobiia bacterium]